MGGGAARAMGGGAGRAAGAGRAICGGGACRTAGGGAGRAGRITGAACCAGLAGATRCADGGGVAVRPFSSRGVATGDAGFGETGVPDAGCVAGGDAGVCWACVGAPGRPLTVAGDGAAVGAVTRVAPAAGGGDAAPPGAVGRAPDGSGCAPGAPGNNAAGLSVGLGPPVCGVATADLPGGDVSSDGLAFTLVTTGVGRRGASSAAAFTAGVADCTCGETAATGGDVGAPAGDGDAMACAGVTVCAAPPGRVMVTMLVVLFTITVLWMLL